MIDRSRVISHGYETGEPTLTEGMLVDAASTILTALSSRTALKTGLDMITGFLALAPRD